MGNSEQNRFQKPKEKIKVTSVQDRLIKAKEEMKAKSKLSVQANVSKTEFVKNVVKFPANKLKQRNEQRCKFIYFIDWLKGNQNAGTLVCMYLPILLLLSFIVVAILHFMNIIL